MKVKLRRDEPAQTGHGFLDATLWIIGDTYGQSRHESQVPFCAAARKSLVEKLRMFDADSNSIRYDTLIPHLQAGETIESASADGKLERSVGALKERIRGSKPNLVLLVGANPLRHVLGLNGIAKWRGHVTWSESLNCKVMAVLHPEVCRKQKYVNKDEKPGSYEALLQNDMRKAVTESLTREYVTPETDYVVGAGFERTMEVLLEMEDAPYLSYDIETLGHTMMDCIGFADSEKRAICVPFYTPAGYEVTPYWDNREEQTAVFRQTAKLLESDIPKIAQNSEFDTTFLSYYYSINVRNMMHDTMVCAHNLYCDLPKDLGTLISLYTNLPYHKYLIKSGKVQDRWEYNAADAVANVHIMNGQLAEASEAGILEHYRSVSNVALEPLREMQKRGVRVDLDMRRLSLLREEERCAAILRALDEVLPLRITKDKKFEHKIKPSSPTDKKMLFYGILGCRKRYVRKKLTLDRPTLEKIRDNDKRKYVKILAKAFIEYSEAAAMRGKMKTPLLNGRMHCKYTVTHTVTGRLNSKKSMLTVNPGDKDGAGTNLQNLKEGVQRQQLVPDLAGATICQCPACQADEEFCYVDLWAAEAYFTALDAASKFFITMLDKGIKPYEWIKDITREAYPVEFARTFPQESTKPKISYKKFKQVVHLSNYGGREDIMEANSGLPRSVCAWIYHKYHKTAPGIQGRMLKIEDSLRTEGTLRSIFGRHRVFFGQMGNDLLNQAYAWQPQSAIGELTVTAMSKIYYNGRAHEAMARAGKVPTVPWMFPAMNTHDGLAIRVKKGNRVAVARAVYNAFAVPFTKEGLTISIPIDLGWADNFNDVKEEKVMRCAEDCMQWA